MNPTHRAIAFNWIIHTAVCTYVVIPTTKSTNSNLNANVYDIGKVKGLLRFEEKVKQRSKARVVKEEVDPIKYIQQ